MIRLILVVMCCVSLGCKKHHPPIYGFYPTPALPKILLKDIASPGLPSPYYHFEYRPDSLISHVSFATGFNMYDVIYDGNQIAEMRNNIIINHDTLRYAYDFAKRPVMINFINDAGVNYRNVNIIYLGRKVKEINWSHKEPTGFVIDRRLTMLYYADENLKELTEHRPAINGQPAINFVTSFEDYDDQFNVDDFTRLHDGIHDHLFLFTRTALQKNNPRKEIRTGDGLNYSVNYSYSYNNDGTPIIKNGVVLITKGPQTGQSFQTQTSYSYY